MTKKRKPLAAGLTNAIGGALVAFEQEIFRGRPHVEERYARRDEVTITSTEGGHLVVGLPDEAPPVDAVSAPTPPAESPG
jgi:hypothetical protein